jgi:hypothetical protein
MALQQVRRTARLVLLAVVIAMMGIPADARHPAFQVGTPQPVDTRNPKIGIHTRLTDEVEEAKVARTWHMVRDMGAAWAVEYFPWAYIEPSKGHYQWTHADMVVEYAYAAGINLIARIGYVPDWARPPNTTSSYLAPERYQDLGDFVYAFVSHYRHRIRYYIIWNEPNMAAEWGFRPVDPRQYTALLQIAYRRGKEADPHAVILAAGLAPTLEPEGSPVGMNELVFLQRMYEAGAREAFDILAAHAYGGTASPDDPPSPISLNFARVELLRQVMVRNGDADKPIIITEGGWNDHPRWARAVRPAQRIAYTLRAYEKALVEWPWCLAVNLWVFRFPRPTQSYNDYYTFVMPDFTPKPIYREVQRYARSR